MTTFTVEGRRRKPAYQQVTCPGRGAAFFMPSAEPGSYQTPEFVTAAALQRTASALRCVWGTILRVASLHRLLGLVAERLSRGVAGVEHVAAGIDHELDAVGRGVARQLVEQDLGAEIGRRQIEQPMHHQQFELRVARENLPQLGKRLRRIEAAAPVPAL